jgi:hypothetical protein
MLISAPPAVGSEHGRKRAADGDRSEVVDLHLRVQARLVTEGRGVRVDAGVVDE